MSRQSISMRLAKRALVAVGVATMALIDPFASLLEAAPVPHPPKVAARVKKPISPLYGKHWYGNHWQRPSSPHAYRNHHLHHSHFYHRHHLHRPHHYWHGHYPHYHLNAFHANPYWVYSYPAYRQFFIGWQTFGTHAYFAPAGTYYFQSGWGTPYYGGFSFDAYRPVGYSYLGNVIGREATDSRMVIDQVAADKVAAATGRVNKWNPSIKSTDEIEGAEQVSAPEVVAAEPVTAVAVTNDKLEPVRLAGWMPPKITDLTRSSAPRPRAIRVERAKPAIRLLAPTSDAWADSAIGTIDDLVERGEFQSAIESCEAMSANPKLPAEVYLRHAILKLFGTSASVENDVVLDLFNAAAAAGCRMEPAELNCESIRIYVAPMEISFDDTLNQISKSAMADPNGSIDLLLLISTLLKLDGQGDRARTFANEAFERAAKTGELKWNSLSRVLLSE